MRVQDEQGPEEITLCIHRMHPNDSGSNKVPRPRLLSIVSNESGTSVQALTDCVEKILAREPLDFSAFADKSSTGRSILEVDSSKEVLNEKPNSMPGSALNPLATKLIQATEAVFHPFDRDVQDILESPEALNPPDQLDPVHHSPGPESGTVANPYRDIATPNPADAVDFTQAIPVLETIHNCGAVSDLVHTQPSQTSQNVREQVSNQDSANSVISPAIIEPHTNPPQKSGSLPEPVFSQRTIPEDQAGMEHEMQSTAEKKTSLAGLAHLPPPKIRIVRATEDYDEMPEISSLRASIDTLSELKTTANTAETANVTKELPEESTGLQTNLSEASNESEVVPMNSTRAATDIIKSPNYSRRASISTTGRSKTFNTFPDGSHPTASHKSPKFAKSLSFTRASGVQTKQNDTDSDSKAPASGPGKAADTTSPLSESPLTSRPTQSIAETLRDAEAQWPQHKQKRKSLVRKTRRVVLRTPVLEMLLGRQLAGQTKPVLRMIADGVDLDADVGVDAESGVAACLAAGLKANVESNTGDGNSCRKCRKCPCRM